MKTIRDGRVGRVQRVPPLRISSNSGGTRCARPTQLQLAPVAAIMLVLATACTTARAADRVDQKEVDRTIARGLDWLAARQSERDGHWIAPGGMYPTAITAMSATALLSEGSTTMQGKYASNIRKAVDYLVDRASHNRNGLIGARDDDRYTYGHGFSMLFLSQVLGEEEDAERRKEIIDVLTNAVKFTGQAQTAAGGWGYVSAKDGGDFDEGSTTITQVQGLRGCRNAGIPVPKEIIDKAIGYIHKCTGPDGGVMYNIHGGGGRPPITAAAIACLFNAGDYDDKYVPKLMRYCELNLGAQGNPNLSFGHWHYAHYYYSQVLYREGGEKWKAYRNEIYSKLVNEANSEGYWDQGFIGAAYTTAINLTILQLDRGTLPIYQR